MSNHHTHPSHTHSFINKYTAPAILLLIIGCFAAGYFLGKHSSSREGERNFKKPLMDGSHMISDYNDYRPY